MSLWETALLFGLLVAAAFDLATRRVPNRLVGVLLLIVLADTWSTGRWLGALDGLLVGGVPLFVIYLLGGMGAGDVKLSAVSCAYFGWPLAVSVLGYTLVIGGVLALLTLVSHGNLSWLWFAPQRIKAAFTAAGPRAGRLSAEEVDALADILDHPELSVPYALAIFGGAAAVVVGAPVLVGSFFGGPMFG